MAIFTFKKDKVKYNPLMKQHRKFRGQQACKAARSIRRKLRRVSIKLSDMEHHGVKHD